VDNHFLLDEDVDCAIDGSVSLVNRDEEEEPSTVIDRRLSITSIGIEATHHETEEQSDEETNPLSGDISSTLSEASPDEKQIALKILLTEREERNS
jgi:hypothetical protein